MAAPLNDTLPRRTPDAGISPNRKLIRPSLADLRDQVARGPASASAPVPLASRLAKKPVPPDQTNAENFYYLKQMQTKTEVVVVFKDGDEIRGIIEWYDRACIKVHRTGHPNLMIFKDTIKYIYKAEEQERILPHP